VYVTRKAMKGSDIANHLINNVIEDCEPLNFDFLDEDVLIAKKRKELNWWIIYFDGAVNIHGNGAKVVIISPNRKQYPVSIKL